MFREQRSQILTPRCSGMKSVKVVGLEKRAVETFFQLLQYNKIMRNVEVCTTVLREKGCKKDQISYFP